MGNNVWGHGFHQGHDKGFKKGVAVSALLVLATFGAKQVSVQVKRLRRATRAGEASTEGDSGERFGGVTPGDT